MMYDIVQVLAKKLEIETKRIVISLTKNVIADGGR